MLLVHIIFRKPASLNLCFWPRQCFEVSVSKSESSAELQLYWVLVWTEQFAPEHSSILHVCILRLVIWGLSAGHCSREMGDAGENDVHRSCRDHQVINAEMTWCIFWFKSHSVVIRAESGRPRRGPRDKLTQKRMVMVAFLLYSLRGLCSSRIICDALLPSGVGIIALLKRTLHKDCVVMVKQFRPPLGCCTLEFPAGLIPSSCISCQHLRSFLALTYAFV